MLGTACGSPSKNGRLALSPARPHKGRAFGGVTTERKTELGRDFQRMADRMRELAGMRDSNRVRYEGRAQAYEHAAELADASGVVS
jgi:hypothetical protein